VGYQSTITGSTIEGSAEATSFLPLLTKEGTLERSTLKLTLANVGRPGILHMPVQPERCTAYYKQRGMPKKPDNSVLSPSKKRPHDAKTTIRTGKYVEEFK
jgi:hypothetical protein